MTAEARAVEMVVAVTAVAVKVVALAVEERATEAAARVEGMVAAARAAAAVVLEVVERTKQRRPRIEDCAHRHLLSHYTSP